jgi:tRNA threonylcarbamoyladenosine biosynthesis protein TsaE
MGAELCVDSRSAEETRRLGRLLGEELGPGDFVGLQGPLGAGKTCLVQGIARGLGVAPEVPVTSPTFVLVGEYPGRLPLRHADFYRVESKRRLEDAGFDDLLDGRGVVVVEWPERFPEVLPKEGLEVSIAIRSESERGIRLVAHGSRAEDLIERVSKRWR